MTTGFFQFFNNRAQRAKGREAASNKARNGRERSALKPRRLLTETLEERQLLAVDVLGASSAVLATYDSANVVNITASNYSIDAIKAAIEAAAATPEDDIIRIPAGKLDFASAADTIEIDYDAQAFGTITIEAVGGDATLDAKGYGRVFTIKNGDVTLTSINITGGSADFGGAIANGGTLTLKDVELTNNVATNAGGAVANKGVLKVQDSVITGNTANEQGAAIYDGDFAWPQVSKPEWTAQIPTQVGPKGGTLTLDLSGYCNEGPWTYAFSCSDPNADIFSSAPTIANGVLTMNFIGEDDYDAMLNLGSVEFTVSASDGSTTVSQTFKASHEAQSAITISAILSNMTFDDIDDEYGQYYRKKLQGFAADELPSSELVDLTDDELYVQVWASDHCYDDGEHELVWNAGDFVTTGYVIVLQLTNATVVESYLPETFCRSGDRITTEDCGNGKYIIYPAYTAGAPFGYDDALLLDMLKIKAIDASQPVSVEIAQYSTDPSLPSAVRMYGSTPQKVDPTQILYQGAISTSTEPYAAHNGVAFGSSESSAVVELVEAGAAANFSVVISNSLIANNSANGSGVVYVGSEGALEVYNTTVADNAASGAALFVEGSGLVGNSIVVNGALAPVTANVTGANNLYEVDSSKPLFKDAASGDYSLATGSQAANIGSIEYAVNVEGAALVNDLAGNSRYSGSGVDAGAYEYQGVAPGAPVNVTISDYVESAKNPTLNWDAPTAADGVTGYYVYFGANETPIATTAVTTLADLGNLVTLEDNSSYKFGVAAYNSYGVSVITVVTLDTTVAPKKPTNVKFGAYASNSSKLTWTKVTNADSYKIELTNVSTGAVVTRTTTSNSYTFTDLEDFATYSCTVTAINSRGQATSSAATLDTTVTPAVPTGLNASAYTGDNTTTLTWNAVEHAAGYKVAKYVDGAWVVVATVDATSFKVEGLVDNTTYTYGVAAYANKGATELVSEYANVTFSTIVAPNAPTNLHWVGAYESNTATLQWNASEGAVGYQVSQFVDGAWVVVGTTTNVQYTITGLTDNQELVFGVSAYSEREGEKLYSDNASIGLNTVVAPASATGSRFLPYAGGSSATLTWNASVGGATGYSIQQLVDGAWTEVGVAETNTFDVAVEENSYYSFRVVAYNVVADQVRYADASSTAYLDTLVPPTGEISVVAGDYDYASGTATLTWNNLAHASSYTVEIKTAAESDYTVLADVAAGSESTVSYALSGLAQHTTYQFRVTAANAKGQGSSGVSEEFYTAAPPTAPVASYVYDAASASATISFSADYADSYVVTDAAGTVLYEGAAGSYVATGLAENQTYVYTVVAKNNIGSSVATEVTVYTAAVPQAPTGLTFGEYADHSATLTWNGVEAETGYNVYALVDGEWTLLTSTAADVTKAVLSGLNDFSSYTVCVTAFNEIGESAKSAAVTLDTTVAPATPTKLTFTFGESESYQGDGKATLTWKAVDHADGYRVQVKIDGQWKQLAYVTTNSYDANGLDNYSSYQFRVASYAMKDGQRLASSYATKTLDTAWIPTGELALVAGEYDSVAKTVDLTWNAAAGATGYKVEKLVDDAWISVTTTTDASYTVTGLTDNTRSVYRVVATNAVGDGSTEQVEFFTAAAPKAPVVSGSYDHATQSATLKWNSDFADSYQLLDETGAVLYEGSATTYVLEGLLDNTTYKFTVVAGNAKGVSPATSYSLYTAAVPAAPTGLAFTEYVDNSAVLSWNAVDSVTGYRVYIQSQSGEWTQVGDDLAASVTSLTLTGLVDFSTYTYSVSAFNAEGEGQRSEAATLDTTVAPAAPTDLHVVYGGSETYQGDGKATLTWSAVEHAAAYVVMQKQDGAWVVVANTTDSSYDIEGLENFNVYEYAVAATAKRGDETLTSESVAVSIDTAWLPEGETTLTIGAYDYVAHNAVMTWTAVDHADGYRLEQRVEGSWVVVTSTSELEYVATLSDNVEYAFRVVAFNAVGDGAESSASLFTFAPPAAPVDAQFGEFVEETGKATMTWSAVPFAEWYEVGVYVDGVLTVVQRDVANYTAEGLVSDMEYVYYVRACNHIGETSVEGYSEWVEVILDTHSATAPVAPSDLQVVDYSESTKTATLTWKDNSRNEEYFTIESSLDGVVWTEYAKLDANVTSVKTSVLQPGTTYFFRIAAGNVYGQSEWVDAQFTTPTGIPAAPSDVAFGEYDQDAHKFEMTWVNNADNALYFNVSYSPNGTDWYDSRDVKADTTSFEWVGLTEGQTYQFRVNAWNAFGVSEYAYGTYEVPYHGQTRPAAPSDITFGEYDYDLNAVVMKWQDNSENEDGFYVQFSFDGQTWRSAGTTAADVAERLACNMIPGRQYYFRVAAYNEAGYSDWAYGEFVAETKLAAPTNFVFGDYADGKLQTSWSYDGTLDAATGGFVVQYSYDNANWQRGGNTAYNVTERVATSVAPGRTYYFRVAAYNGSEYSEWLYSGAYTVASCIPTAPTDLAASENTNNSVKLTWTDKSDIEVGYNVQYSVDGGATWISAGNTSANITTKTVSSLRSGATYQFRVRAYNYYGASEWVSCEFTTAASENAPNAPSDVVLSDYNAANKTMKMKWTDNASNETGFTVQYTYDGGKTWYISGNYAADTESRTATGLVAGRTYQFRVCAYNADGASDWAYSEEYYVDASDYVPTAPTGLTATLEGKTATLAWADNASNETGYKVEYKIGDGEWMVAGNVAANATSYTAADLNAGATYTFRVSAYNSYGSSALSNEATVAVPVDEFDAPEIKDFVYSSNKRTLQINWAEVADSTYKVQYSLDQTNWYGLSANGASATLTGASYGKTYYFRVQAISAEGESSEWVGAWYNTQTGEYAVSNASEDASLALLDSLFAANAIDNFFDELL